MKFVMVRDCPECKAYLERKGISIPIKYMMQRQNATTRKWSHYNQGGLALHKLTMKEEAK